MKRIHTEAAGPKGRCGGRCIRHDALSTNPIIRKTQHDPFHRPVNLCDNAVLAVLTELLVEVRRSEPTLALIAERFASPKAVLRPSDHGLLMYCRESPRHMAIV